MKIKNLTPHTINLVTNAGTIEIKPGAICPRVSSVSRQIDTLFVDGLEIPVTVQSMGSVEDLPAVEAGVVLIVSRLVTVACPDRPDLVCPADLVRDEDGQIIGCRALESVASAADTALPCKCGSGLSRFDCMGDNYGYVEDCG